MSVSIQGFVHNAFEPLRSAFEVGFAGRPKMGAALCVIVGGQVVADLWGGVADLRNGRCWDEHTPGVIFSCTKGIVSVMIARLVQDGYIDYAAPVARYWPEFAQRGKASITVAQLLSHRAGLSALRQPLTLGQVLNWDAVVATLAEQEPLWLPGSGHAYHALTHGWLAGELIRRVTGRSVGDHFRATIAGPLGLEAWIGLPADRQTSVAHIGVDAPLAAAWAEERERPGPNWSFAATSLGGAFPLGLVTEDGGFNTPAVRAAELPGAGGIATARALAGIWSAVVSPVCGKRLLEASTIAVATLPQSVGPNVFGAPPPWYRWGMGLHLDSPRRPLLSAHSFGHDGAGGQVCFADPDRGIGFAYITNWMMGRDDRRAQTCIETLAGC